MENNKGFRKYAGLGVLFLLVGAVAIAAGVVVSIHMKNSRIFNAFSIPAAILFVAGGAMTGRAVAVKRGKLLISGGERTITAKVLGVTRNLRTAGEKTVYYIVCRYQDPMTGREETYTSRALDQYPGREVIGREVTVHLDPREKGKYTVEVDDLLESIQREKREGK